MADLASNVPQMSTSQASKEVTFNALIDATSQGLLFGRNYETTTGLTWGYIGGLVSIDGVITRIANGTVSLANNNTSYVESTRAGVVSSNTTAFTAGRIPLYIVDTVSGFVTNYTDVRMPPQPFGFLAFAMSDANQTLTAAQARNQVLRFSGTLTTQRNIVLPLAPQQWTVRNGTTQALQFIGPTGTGVIVAVDRTAIVYSDGTNVLRVTADVA
jgi:hypothetical protein